MVSKMNRIKNPEDMDRLPLNSSSQRLPHPVDLVRWTRDGLVTMDMENYCYRFVPKGGDRQNRKHQDIACKRIRKADDQRDLFMEPAA